MHHHLKVLHEQELRPTIGQSVRSDQMHHHLKVLHEQELRPKSLPRKVTIFSRHRMYYETMLGIRLSN